MESSQPATRLVAMVRIPNRTEGRRALHPEGGRGSQPDFRCMSAIIRFLGYSPLPSAKTMVGEPSSHLGAVAGGKQCSVLVLIRISLADWNYAGRLTA
jgi:hypothetical protein